MYYSNYTIIQTDAFNISVSTRVQCSRKPLQWSKQSTPSGMCVQDYIF